MGCIRSNCTELIAVAPGRTASVVVVINKWINKWIIFQQRFGSDSRFITRTGTTSVKKTTLMSYYETESATLKPASIYVLETFKYVRSCCHFLLRGSVWLATL